VCFLGVFNPLFAGPKDSLARAESPGAMPLYPEGKWSLFPLPLYILLVPGIQGVFFPQEVIVDPPPRQPGLLLSLPKETAWTSASIFPPCDCLLRWFI
jgi:hypothetical protein